MSALVTRTRSVATATIAYAEVYAGLGRKRRAGELSPSEYGRTCGQFEEEWPAYVRLDLRDDILLLARDLIQRQPLRGLDAIHLASAVTLRDALGEEVLFVAADEGLLRAAKAERFSVLDVERRASP